MYSPSRLLSLFPSLSPSSFLSFWSFPSMGNLWKHSIHSNGNDNKKGNGNGNVIKEFRSFSSSPSSSSPSPSSPPRFSPIVRPPILSGNVYSSSLDSIGNTSLIYLRGVSELTKCHIYGKAEWQNPGGSVKDRAALWIIKDAEQRKVLHPGNGKGIIVEGTAGNTGIGLTLVGNSRGYKTIIVIADSQSKEKKDTLRQCGATLLEVPAVPFKNPMNYVHVAYRLSRLLSSRGLEVLYADQWDNLANRKAHYESTGPEIWAQLKGKIDAFSCATGTGGTLTGTGTFLREKDRNVKIFLTDPCGAGLVRFFNEGKMSSVGDSISEGVGQNRITGNMLGFRPDGAIEVTDSESLPILNDLLSDEGLPLGSSSAINVCGAMKVAQKLGPNHTIVTILCDLGSRYTNKLYNTQFLKSRNLPTPKWLNKDQENDMDIVSSSSPPLSLTSLLHLAMTPPFDEVKVEMGEKWKDTSVPWK